jgi:hypothetical protein
MPTYLELERSRFQSKPIKLFHFYRGTEDWYYTSNKFVVVFDSQVFLPLAIKHSQVEYGGEDLPGACPVSLPVDSDLGQVLKLGAMPTPVQLDIIRLQRDASTQPAIIFKGELGAGDVQNRQITVQCWPFESQLNLVVPQGLYQRDYCQWNTYDEFTCKVNKATFTFTGVIEAISGTEITVTDASTFDPGTGVREDMFVNGIFQKDEYQVLINAQAGDVLTLIEPIPGLLVGDSVDLVAGDDRTLTTCSEKFANAGRRLAFRWMPVVDPFYGQGFNAAPTP